MHIEIAFISSQTNKITTSMGALRMTICKKTAPTLLRFTDPKQYEMYKEVLSFDGGLGFASEDEVIVKKTDGTTFRASIRHYESDFLTETYVGRFPNGEQFRFLFASSNNPLAQLDPMVSFAGMSTSGWAVHFKVR